MISVLPERVNFRDLGDILQIIQRDISDFVELEHVALGRVQNWVRPGEILFESLFSVSVKEDIHSRLWNIVDSEPPQPDVSLFLLESIKAGVTELFTVYFLG